VLFCLYFDGLLLRLAKTNIGCFIGKFFVGALAYADDVVLLAPSARAMRTMLAVCDSYASEFRVTFNAKKSKCIVCSPRNVVGRSKPINCFTVGGSTIEFVSEWPHLGHIITQTLSDSADVQNRRNVLVGQINNVLCYFGKVDTVTKVKLMKSYCSSFYGCELWDLWENEMDHFAKAWRQGQRSVWKLPYNTHRKYLSLLCDSIPIEDEVCRRFLSFVSKCLSSECKLVQFVAKYGLSCGGMYSLCGRNALFCANRFSFSVNDIFRPQFSLKIVNDTCDQMRSVEDVAAVCMIFELVCLRDNLFYFSGDEHCTLTRDDINTIIGHVCCKDTFYD